RMEGQSKMRAAKDALRRVLEQIDPGTHVGLLAFGSVGRGRWLYPLGPVEDRTRLTQAVSRLEAAGGTPLGACIKLGADALLEDRESQFGYGTSTLLVVTDGEANDNWLVDEYAPEVVARGIRLDVIGVAMAKQHTLAQTAHSYRRADDPKSLERAVSEVFAEVTAQSTDAAPGEGAFELAAAFEPEMAMEVITALASSGNHPIGEKPPEPLQAVTESGDTQAADFNTTTTVDDEDDSGTGIFPYVFLFFAIALTWMIRSASKSKA
ncbi:MAG: vWA domain-containing protein, partial [Myxococcota bacterium]